MSRRRKTRRQHIECHPYNEKTTRNDDGRFVVAVAEQLTAHDMHPLVEENRSHLVAVIVVATGGGPSATATAAALVVQQLIRVAHHKDVAVAGVMVHHVQEARRQHRDRLVGRCAHHETAARRTVLLLLLLLLLLTQFVLEVRDVVVPGAPVFPLLAGLHVVPTDQRNQQGRLSCARRIKCIGIVQEKITCRREKLSLTRR